MGQEFCQAVEIPAVIKFPVVRQGRFADKSLRQATLFEFSILGNEGGIIFAGPAIFIHSPFIKGNIAEDDANILRGCNEILPVIAAVTQKSALLPKVT